jgi:hypothetical protein
METAIENILTLAEDLLLVLLKTKYPKVPIEFVQIPTEQRNPQIPIRIRAQMSLRPNSTERDNNPENG